MRQRPTIFLWLAFLLTVLVGSGPALPAAGVWQCRYSSHVASAAAVVPGAMPCKSMPMSGHARMACCAARPLVAAHRAHLAPADCHPTFTPLIAVPFAITAQGRVALPHIATIPGAPSYSPASLAPAILPLSLRQRPPPDMGLFHSCFAFAYCLRGPPSA